jgi:transcriptional regulator of arginine metabolism
LPWEALPSPLEAAAPALLIPDREHAARIAYLSNLLYIYTSADSATRTAHSLFLQDAAMKIQRLDAIREVLTSSAIASQDELRRKLRRRGFRVTQATLSRDIHELKLSKGPGGYSLPNRHGNGAVVLDDEPPSLEEVLQSFGLRVRQAMNQVVVGTVLGGAQPVAAALDRASWPEVLGTIAGDDTVLVICSDQRRASEVETRIRTQLES